MENYINKNNVNNFNFRPPVLVSDIREGFEGRSEYFDYNKSKEKDSFFTHDNQEYFRGELIVTFNNSKEITFLISEVSDRIISEIKNTNIDFLTL